MRKFYSGIVGTFCSLLILSDVHSQTTLVNSNFEVGDPTVWTLVNAAATNQWFVGTATASGGTQSAYITTDAGTTNSYDIAVSTPSNHIYTPVTFPAGEGAIILSFDWRNIGEQTSSTWDFIRVSLTSAAPVAGTVPATTDQLPVVFAGSGTYVKGWVVIPSSYAGTTRNLVFSWRNDASGGTGTPGPSIDNIFLTSATASPLSGSLAIPGAFASVAHAVANLDAHGVGAGGVTFNIAAGSTFNETVPAITVTGTAGNPIIFQKSGVGANPLITSTGTGNYGPTSTGSSNGVGDAVLAIVGSDYITFDGIDVASGDYSSGFSMIDFGYKIINASATDGAQNNLIQNTSITLQRENNTSCTGILQSSSSTGGGFTASAASGANSNNKYYNIQIQNAYSGINLNCGTTTAANTDANNEVGTTGGGSTIIGAAYVGSPTGDIGGPSTTSSFGIQATNQTSVKIFNTLVRNIAVSTTVRGVYLNGCLGNSLVYNNKVFGIKNLSTSSTSSAIGIELDIATSGTHTIEAYNNFIGDITSAYTGTASSTRQLKGILTGSSASTSVYNVSYNSVYIDGSGSPNISSVALEFGSSTPINNVRNNILANFTGAQSGVAVHTAIRSSSTTAVGAASSICNYNDLYIDNTTNGYVAINGTTNQTTIAGWTAAISTNPGTDANSISANPAFLGTTDLHISNTSNSVNGLATPLAGLTTDIDGDTRDVTTPDIGADEYTPIGGIDMGVTELVAPISTGCYTNSETVTVSIKNFATSTHDFTLNPVTVTVNVSGAVVYTSNIVINSGTLASNASINVNMPSTLNMSSAGIYTFEAYTNVAGDISATNDSMVAVNRTVIASETLPQTQDFTGFTGSNLTTVYPLWKEATGPNVPSGSTSTWLSSTLIPGAGTSARINLDANANRDWIIGPKFTAAANTVLKFDVAITDAASANPDPDGMAGNTSGVPADDSVIVRISTDCGVSFSDIYVLDATNTASISNSYVLQTVNLSAYAGQNIIIAFYATEGTVNDAQDYDFHIDNINIYNLTPIDAGAVFLETPVNPGSACYTNTETVTVRVRNYGSSVLDFASTPLTVTTNVTGVAVATLTGTKNTGTLAPDATTTVTMSTTLDMTATGTYIFNAFTSIAGDGGPANDAMQDTTRFNAPIVPLPQTVNFTGFTGSNLATVFPEWYEADGQFVPAGTTSSWASSTAIAGSGTTARINLAGTTDHEWIVGPKFSPTAVSRLRFKVAITDASSSAADPDGMAGVTSGVPTDDSVVVKISTDCGGTFTNLFVFDATNTSGISNSLVEHTIPLGSYAGQKVIIAFYASEGTVDNAPSYDFHIDDINIETPPPVDAGAVALVAPGTQACYSNAEQVTVRVKNHGSAILDFSNTPLTVTTNVSGVVTTTLTGILNSGTLAVDSFVNVTMSTTLDMSAFGSYMFNAYTTIAGDGVALNDTLVPEAVRTVVAVVAGTASTIKSYVCVSGAPVLTLTGHQGGNIQWQESTVSASGPWTNVGTNSNTYTPASPISGTTYYQAVVSCGANTATSNVVTVELTNPSVLNTTPATRCGTGTVNLQATASPGASLYWYGAATGGSPIGTGTTFTTPSISSTTAFYVGAGVVPGSQISLGRADRTTLTANTSSNTGLVFDAPTGGILESVSVYPSGTGAGTLKIVLKTGNTSAATRIDSVTVNLTGVSIGSAPKTVVPLNLYVPPGSNYYLSAEQFSGALTGLGRELTGGGPFPYTAAGTDWQITGSWITTSAPTTTTYYYFYDWKINNFCESPRTAVVATVDPPSVGGTVSSDQTICTSNTPADLTLSGHTGSVIKWQSASDAAFTTPVDIAVTSTTLTGAQIGPLTTTTYFRAVVQSGVCTPANSSSVTITVSPGPTAIITYNGSPYCGGSGAASVTQTGSTGGVYSSTAGLAINASTGEVDLVTSTPGTYTVTYFIAASGGCPAFSTTAMITISAPPAATINYAGSPYCNGPGTASVTLTGTAGGTFSSTLGLSINATTGEIDLAASTAGSYTVTYTIVASGGCALFSTTAPITISTAPTATISYDGSPYCISPGMANVTFAGTTGGVFSATPAGLTIDAATGQINLGTSSSGTYTVTYTIAASGGCPQFSTTAPVVISPAGMWLGVTSSDWNTASNWCGGIPSSTTDVVIPSTAPNMPDLSGGTGSVRNLTLSAGSSMVVGTGGILRLFGNLSGTGTFDATSGSISFLGATTQTTPAITAINIEMNGAGGWTPGGNVVVTGTLTLNNGNITLGANNISLHNSSTGSVNSHIIINGAGRAITLNMPASSSRVVPVATDASSYNPVWLVSNTGHVTDNFSVGILTGVFINGVSGAQFTTHVVDRTWLITEGTPGGSNINLTLQWDDSQELTSFNRSKSYIAYHDGIRWVPGLEIPAGGADPYTQTALNVSNFGSFIVQTQPIPRPLTGIYPNPATSVLNVVLDLPAAQTVNIKVFDASGKFVMEKTASMNAGLNLYTMDVTSLSGGLYFIRVSIAANPEFLLTKFIKQ